MVLYLTTTPSHKRVHQEGTATDDGGEATGNRAGQADVQAINPSPTNIKNMTNCFTHNSDKSPVQ